MIKNKKTEKESFIKHKKNLKRNRENQGENQGKARERKKKQQQQQNPSTNQLLKMKIYISHHVLLGNPKQLIRIFSSKP